jgi:hypothetical protein
VVGGGKQPAVDVSFPAAVEWANGKLYATIDIFQSLDEQGEPVLGDGKVVTITP